MSDAVSQAVPQAVPQVDLGLSFRGLTADPEWFKKYALIGLVLMIPVVGWIIWMGWLRRVYDLAKQGDIETLPELDLGEDLSYGLTPLLAALNLAVPAGVLMVCVWVAMMVLVLIGSAIDGGSNHGGAGGMIAGLGMLVLYPMMFILIIAMNVLVPELWRRGFNGEAMPLLSPMQSVHAIRRRLGAYFTVLLGMFVANMIASLGAFACYVGMFVTMPMGMVIVVRLLAQWDAVVEHARIEAGELDPTG